MKYRILLIGTAMVLGGLVFGQPRAERGQRAVRNLDANQDGEVTLEEYLAAAEARFENMDQNGDGVLTRDDRKERRQRNKLDETTLFEAVASRFLLRADEDQDRSVTETEWKDYLSGLETDESGALVMGEGERRGGHRNHRGLGPRGLLDLNGNEMLDLEDLENLFAALDKNEDQVVDQDELVRLPRRIRSEDGPFPGRFGNHGVHRSIGRGGLLVLVADDDGNGEVSGEEWRAFLSGLDDDGDGVIDIASLIQDRMQDSAGARSDHAGERITRHLDSDGDGILEITDLDAKFAALDQNQDGTLQADELGPKMRRRGRR